MRNKLKIKKIILSGVFIAIGILLPFLTGQIPTIGRMLLPMHIPVMLAGYICGLPYGIIVGIITPLLRSVLFSMPPMLSALAMAAELGAYGGFTALFYKLLPKKNINIFISLIGAMLCGRAVWGAATALIMAWGQSGFTFAAFISGAFLTAAPGIVLQLILIPAIIITLKKTGVMKDYEK